MELTLPADFDGVLGLDYEGWQPVWDAWLYTGIKEISMKLVRAKNPTMDNATVLATAEQEFLEGAKKFYLTTIQTLKEARPKMRVGFYDTPFRGWHSYSQAEYLLRTINVSYESFNLPLLGPFMTDSCPE